MKIALIVVPVLLAVTAGAGSTFVRVRSNLVEQRTNITTQWTDVDHALQQRSGLINSLATQGQTIAPTPAALLQEVRDAHRVVTGIAAPQDKIRANDRLSSALAQLLVAAEDHPALRSNPAFLRLQDEIKRSEDRIALARLKYNDALEHYNARIQSFPHNLVAKVSGFGRNDAYFPTEQF